MPRPVRKGLSYYPRDIDHLENDRIFMLIDRYGPLGYMAYDVILSVVYRDGYYIEIDRERLANRIIRAVGNRWIRNRRQILELIEYISEIGLIDAELMERGVVTSADIQQCYAEVTSRRKFHGEKFWLLGGSNNAAERNNAAESNAVSVAEIFFEDAKTVITETETLHGECAQEVSVYSENTKKNKENKTKENNTKQNTTALPVEGQSGDEMCWDAYAEFCNLIRTPKPAECMKLEKLCEQYGQRSVVVAIRDASLKGGRSATYVERILQSCFGDGGAKAASERHTHDSVRSMGVQGYSAQEIQAIDELLDEEYYAEYYTSIDTSSDGSD